MKRLIIDRGQNHLEVLLEGKYHLVRCKTLHQFERYEAYAKEKTDDQAKPGNLFEALRGNHRDYLEVCEIALNPEPSKLEWPKDRIEAALSMDAIQILASLWIDRFFAPRKDADPCLAPPEEAGRA